MESYSFIIFIVIWFVFQKWVFPKMGIQSWMSANSCRVTTDSNDKEETEPEERKDLSNNW